MIDRKRRQTPVLGRGNPLCAGCGAMQMMQQACRVLGDKTVFVNAAGCLTLLAVYPWTPFRGSWLYTAMASAPAGAQGVRDALDILRTKGEVAADDDLQVVVLTGDGSAYGMGLSATSGALDRRLDFLYLCYDNEGYGNTGHQSSAATPHAAHTATCHSPGGVGGFKKDLFAIWAAHRPSYLATAIASQPDDLARKIATARELSGPRLIISLSPCPTGWGFEPRYTTAIGQLAVETGIWPLKEYRDGEIRHTWRPKKRRPVTAYLERQQRFAHLFQPQRNEALLAEWQAAVDRYWETMGDDGSEVSR